MKPTMILDGNGNPVQALGLGAVQTIDGTSVSTASTVFDANEETVVRCVALGDLWIKVAVAPVSVAETCSRLSSGQSLLVSVPKGYKISALGAKLNLTVCY